MLLKFLQAGEELVQEIKKSILESKETCIAVAFVKEDGFGQIVKSLEKALRKGNEIRFIIGASDGLGITDSSVLSSCLRLKKEHKGFLVKFYNHSGFHPKLFIFKNGRAVKIIIGSSNLTGGGVVKNLEANVLIKTTTNHKLFKTVSSVFGMWFDNGDELTKKFVDYYKKISSQHKNRLRELRFQKELRTTFRTHLLKEGEKPSKQRIDRKAVFWKIAPGPRGTEWPLWENEIHNGKGYIAVGWKDLNKILSLNEEKAIKMISRKWDGNPRYVYMQGRFFYRDMKKGDIVIAYSKRTIFGIGKIMGDAYYAEESPYETRYLNRREVEWIWRGKPTKPPKKYAKILSTYDTIHLIKDKATINYIKRLIEK